jgi:potassium-transporting ATPase KdpC subunit
MKALLKESRAAVAATLVLALTCCGLYPAAVTVVAQLAFRDKANGSLIVDKAGVIRGSALLGQGFKGPGYFHPRPSAAGNGYDPTSSSGSNLGPTSQKLADNLVQGLAAYRDENGMATNAVVPADAVTASASGLDPHISPANAALQAARVAKARGLARGVVDKMIRDFTDGPDLGLFGDPGVNVLRLNLALDEATRGGGATGTTSAAR